MEYFVALKNMELLSHATTWMDAGDIMQSEINLSQKDLTPLNTAGSSEVTRDACALKGRWVMTCGKFAAKFAFASRHFHFSNFLICVD